MYWTETSIGSSLAPCFYCADVCKSVDRVGLASRRELDRLLTLPEAAYAGPPGRPGRVDLPRKTAQAGAARRRARRQAPGVEDVNCPVRRRKDGTPVYRLTFDVTEDELRAIEAAKKPGESGVGWLRRMIRSAPLVSTNPEE